MKYASVRTHVEFSAAELTPGESQLIVEFWGRAIHSDSWATLNSTLEVDVLPRFAVRAKLWYEDAWSRGGSMARFPLTTYRMHFYAERDSEGAELAVVDVLRGTCEILEAAR